MAQEPKKERNKQLFTLRKKDPKRYTFGELAKIFNISRIWAYQIYERERARKVLGLVDK